ncbi:hypothetical protein AAFF_G00229410 [Aldrovandia affinis]|uniref:Uncharacterized protein n=1 Tax=Aldrovandia affinis TaxID=143900 RepID=A0AAD7SVN9_9TELE|nr:hypothetical protein AAFF_G00229410 [Aldrovandia affinis]
MTGGRNMGVVFGRVFGQVFGWLLLRACALLVDVVALTRRWTAPEVLEEPVNDGGCSEEGDLGPEEFPDALEWGDPVQEQAHDTTEEYFDTHSWQSDTFSDLSPDSEDCPAAMLATGGPCTGWSRPTGRTLRPTSGSSVSVCQRCARRPPIGPQSRWRMTCFLLVHLQHVRDVPVAHRSRLILLGPIRS